MAPDRLPRYTRAAAQRDGNAKTAPGHRPVLFYVSSVSCRCMGLCCSTVRISSSKLPKVRRSPESGKYTVPCHSCFSAAVTAISNRGVCFMLRVLSCLTALVGLVSSASLYGDFTTKSTAFLLPVSGCETGNARGSSRGHRLCSLSAACTASDPAGARYPAFSAPGKYIA